MKRAPLSPRPVSQRWLVVAMATTAALVIGAAPAGGSSVGQSLAGPDELRYQANPGEDNHLVVRMQSSVLVFEDNFYIQPGTGCWPGTRSDANKPHAAYCLQSAATSLDLQLADGANFAYMYADHDSTISGPGGGRKRRGDRR